MRKNAAFFSLALMCAAVVIAATHAGRFLPAGAIPGAEHPAAVVPQQDLTITVAQNPTAISQPTAAPATSGATPRPAQQPTATLTRYPAATTTTRTAAATPGARATLTGAAAAQPPTSALTATPDRSQAPGTLSQSGASGPAAAGGPTTVPSPTTAPEPGNSVSLSKSTAGLLPPDRIVAPTIKLDSMIIPVGWRAVQNPDGSTADEWIVASNAVSWNETSALPGEPGNTVLTGHNNEQGEVFRHLEDFKIGDPITLYARDQTFHYRVTDKFVVQEAGVPYAQRLDNAKWIGPFPDERITLVSCWPYTGNSHRIIVIAHLDEEKNG